MGLLQNGIFLEYIVGISKISLLYIEKYPNFVSAPFFI
jgi:hypothetical protein